MNTKVICLVATACCFSATALAYDVSFTLDMEETGAVGWIPRNTGNTVETGVNTPTDATPYSPAPTDVTTGYNGSDWLAIGTTEPTFFGITTVHYDGTAGGSTTVEPTDYTVEVDMFVPVSYALRYHAGVGVRWNDGDGDAPFEAFYSQNTPGQTNGFGYRNTGAGTGANVYGLFPAIVASHWVTIKMQVIGTEGTVSFDADYDGVYDHVSEPIVLSGVAEGPGKIVLFGVFNDPGASNAASVNQHAYFDNLVYTPAPSSVGGWMLY